METLYVVYGKKLSVALILKIQSQPWNEEFKEPAFSDSDTSFITLVRVDFLTLWKINAYVSADKTFITVWEFIIYDSYSSG